MKKIIFLSLVGFYSVLLAQNPQITNGSFENWTPQTFKSLQDYYDSGDDNYGIIEQSTDAVHGQYSVKLESRLQDGEVQTGYFINFDGDSFTGGIAYSQHVDSICGYYKAHLIAQDSALLLAFFKKNSVVVGGGLYKFAADRNTNTWTRFCYPTQMPSSVVSDTLMFGVASSNAIDEVGMENGSWIQLDSISLKSGNQLLPTIPNYSFENWDEYTVSFPDNFDSSLKWIIDTNPLPVEKVTDATDGNFAVKLTTVHHLQSNDTIQGAITNGNMDGWPFSGGLVIGQIPDEISWDYKVQIAGFQNYDPSINFIFRLNGNHLSTYGSVYSNTVNSYQHQVAQIDLTTVPDTLQFVAFSGDYPGNSLWIDNIELHYPSGITENLNIHQVAAFPVPAKDKVNLKITAVKPENISIKLYDMNGKVVWQNNYNLQTGNNDVSIATGQLPAGTYQFVLSGERSSIVKKFLIH